MSYLGSSRDEIFDLNLDDEEEEANGAVSNESNVEENNNNKKRKFSEVSQDENDNSEIEHTRKAPKNLAEASNWFTSFFNASEEPNDSPPANNTNVVNVNNNNSTNHEQVPQPQLACTSVSSTPLISTKHLVAPQAQPKVTNNNTNNNANNIPPPAAKAAVSPTQPRTTTAPLNQPPSVNGKLSGVAPKSILTQPLQSPPAVYRFSINQGVPSGPVPVKPTANASSAAPTVPQQPRQAQPPPPVQPGAAKSAPVALVAVPVPEQGMSVQALATLQKTVEENRRMWHQEYLQNQRKEAEARRQSALALQNTNTAQNHQNKHQELRTKTPAHSANVPPSAVGKIVRPTQASPSPSTNTLVRSLERPSVPVPARTATNSPQPLAPTPVVVRQADLQAAARPSNVINVEVQSKNSSQMQRTAQEWQVQPHNRSATPTPPLRNSYSAPRPIAATVLQTQPQPNSAARPVTPVAGQAQQGHPTAANSGTVPASEQPFMPTLTTAQQLNMTSAALQSNLNAVPVPQMQVQYHSRPLAVSRSGHPTLLAPVSSTVPLRVSANASPQLSPRGAHSPQQQWGTPTQGHITPSVSVRGPSLQAVPQPALTTAAGSSVSTPSVSPVGPNANHTPATQSTATPSQGQAPLRTSNPGWAYQMYHSPPQQGTNGHAAMLTLRPQVGSTSTQPPPNHEATARPTVTQPAQTASPDPPPHTAVQSYQALPTAHQSPNVSFGQPAAPTPQSLSAAQQSAHVSSEQSTAPTAPSPPTTPQDMPAQSQSHPSATNKLSLRRSTALPPRRLVPNQLAVQYAKQSLKPVDIPATPLDNNVSQGQTNANRPLTVDNSREREPCALISTARFAPKSGTSGPTNDSNDNGTAATSEGRDETVQIPAPDQSELHRLRAPRPNNNLADSSESLAVDVSESTAPASTALWQSLQPTTAGDTSHQEQTARDDSHQASAATTPARAPGTATTSPGKSGVHGPLDKYFTTNSPPKDKPVSVPPSAQSIPRPPEVIPIDDSPEESSAASPVPPLSPLVVDNSADLETRAKKGVVPLRDSLSKSESSEAKDSNPSSDVRLKASSETAMQASKKVLLPFSTTGPLVLTQVVPPPVWHGALLWPGLGTIKQMYIELFIPTDPRTLLMPFIKDLPKLLMAREMIICDKHTMPTGTYCVQLVSPVLDRHALPKAFWDPNFRAFWSLKMYFNNMLLWIGPKMIEHKAILCLYISLHPPSPQPITCVLSTKPEDMIAFFNMVGMNHYCAEFQRNGIDSLHALCQITHQQLAAIVPAENDRRVIFEALKSVVSATNAATQNQMYNTNQ